MKKYLQLYKFKLYIILYNLNKLINIYNFLNFKYILYFKF